MHTPEALPCVAQHVGRTYLKTSQNWIYEQVRALQSVRAVFLATQRKADDAFPWPAVYTLDALPLPAQLYNHAAHALTGAYPHHVAACRREGVRLLHLHFGGNAAREHALARRLGVPFAASFYGRDMFYHPQGEAGLREKYRGLFARGAAFIAEGPAARAQLVRIGCPPEKVHVHRLGVDLDRLPLQIRRVAPGEPLRVLMAARFTEKKGMAYGVEAFCRVARDEPRLHLTVVGDAGDAEDGQQIRRDLHTQVAASGLSARVTFTGFLSNDALHALARTHHLLLHPSVHARDGDAEGGHPVVITELAATGMPVLATRHCDIPEVVVDHETGWLCAERDPAALAAALREALAHPDRLATYGAAARHLVAQKYDARHNTLDALYTQLLEAPPTAA